MNIRINRSGVTQYRGNYNKKRKVRTLKQEVKDAPTEIPKSTNQKLAEDFKDLSISGDGFNKDKLKQVASEVLPTTKKLQKFIKFNI
jgi:hypothetical protein